MKSPQQTILRVLEYSIGDDLERMKIACRGRTTIEMQHKFFHSGKTYQEILDEYQRERDEIQAAIAWVKAQKN